MEGWKTVLFNSILALVGVLDMLGVVLPETFAADLNGAILAGVGVVGIILRAITSTPVGWKQ